MWSILLALLLATAVHAQDAALGATAGARRKSLSLLTTPIASLPTTPYAVAAGATTVAVRFERQGDNGYHIFIPAPSTTLPAEARLLTPGSYIIRRRLADGAVDQIKVFLHADAGSFIRVRPRPHAPTVELDLYLAGEPFYRAVPVAMTLTRAIVAPFDELVRATATTIDWGLVFPDTAVEGYRRVAEIVTTIRRHLPTLRDAEDGAMDRWGRYVTIADGVVRSPGGFNCSGFAKWVVDGLYQPLAGTLIPIERLTRRHPDSRGSAWYAAAEAVTDPYFGLDWTRNLAWEVAGARDDGGVAAGVRGARLRGGMCARWREPSTKRMSVFPSIARARSSTAWRSPPRGTSTWGALTASRGARL